MQLGSMGDSGLAGIQKQGMNPGVGCKLSDLFAKEQQSNSSTNVEGMHNPEIYGPDQSYQQQGTYEQFVLTQKQNFLSSTGQEDNGASYENQQMYGELQSPSTLSNQSMSPSPPPPPRVYKPCVVCNDKSSGYHYGVSSCEGCKGFFRRSVQKNMQYTCHKDKNCTINKVTRNRCQYCRLQKCFARGMSKEAVRSDRNKKKKPKPESTTTNVSQSTEEMTINDQSVIKTIVDAHKLTFPYTMEGKELPVYSKSSGNMVESEECSMESDNVQSQSRKEDANVKKSDVLWETIIDFSPAAVLKIVEFAKKVPGFLSLALSDQITLLKSACLEIMILRLTHRYDPDKDAMIFEDKEYQRGDLKNVGLGPGADFIFKLAASLKDMDVDETEIAMLSAICLISGDRSGLEEPDKIEQLQEPLLEALRRYMRFRRSEQPNMFPKIIIKLIDLRDLSIQSAIKVLRSRRESSELELPPLIVEMLDREENVSIP